MNTVRLDNFNNDWYKPGNMIKIIAWHIVSTIFFRNSCICVPYALKRSLLSIFGAKVGKNLVIKPSVNIKYPWFLEIGDNSWIGEGAWIDNMAFVKIGSNVCISQGALLITGSHDYKSSSFGLITKEITIEDGVWVGAKAVVCPGVKCKSHSVLTVGSVATHDLESYKIYQGNPAVYKRERFVIS